MFPPRRVTGTRSAVHTGCTRDARSREIVVNHKRGEAAKLRDIFETLRTYVHRS